MRRPSFLLPNRSTFLYVCLQWYAFFFHGVDRVFTRVLFFYRRISAVFAISGFGFPPSCFSGFRHFVLPASSPFGLSFPASCAWMSGLAAIQLSGLSVVPSLGLNKSDLCTPLLSFVCGRHKPDHSRTPHQAPTIGRVCKEAHVRTLTLLTWGCARRNAHSLIQGKKGAVFGRLHFSVKNAILILCHARQKGKYIPKSVKESELPHGARRST